MTLKPQQFGRRSLRLRDYDYSQAGAYFVTVCSHNRECLLGEVVDGKMLLNDPGNIVASEWLRTAELRENVILDEFVIMPNHFHGILFIYHAEGATRRVAPTKEPRPKGPLPGSIGAIVAQFKSNATKRINNLRQTPGIPIWQRNYYERVIRDEDELNRIRQYILDNPVRWREDEYNPLNL